MLGRMRPLKPRKTLALHRRRRPQVLSAAAASSSPCRFHLCWHVVFIFAGTSFSSSSSPGSSARRFHLRWLLGTEPRFPFSLDFWMLLNW
ncbi:hypothetical protein Ahy_A05g024656 isoform I [Arachis hypogaea]|uniref:Uncharacterized protein n=1 Tax=Arachis hypogaea TaxID=3818 RepID=A0A445D699_ARAHY|nr:hypothetical protein Ahy_A05g024656 isoform I [Arachis hypogaea]